MADDTDMTNTRMVFLVYILILSASIILQLVVGWIIDSSSMSSSVFGILWAFSSLSVIITTLASLYFTHTIGRIKSSTTNIRLLRFVSIIFIHGNLVFSSVVLGFWIYALVIKDLTIPLIVIVILCIVLWLVLFILLYLVFICGRIMDSLDDLYEEYYHVYKEKGNFAWKLIIVMGVNALQLINLFVLLIIAFIEGLDNGSDAVHPIVFLAAMSIVVLLFRDIEKSAVPKDSMLVALYVVYTCTIVAYFVVVIIFLIRFGVTIYATALGVYALVTIVAMLATDVAFAVFQFVDLIVSNVKEQE